MKQSVRGKNGLGMMFEVGTSVSTDK